MFILDSTVKSLQIVLAGAITTNQLPFTTSYVDVTTATQAVTPGAQDGVSNSGTAVTVMASPSSGNERRLVGFSIQNADTAAATLTIELNDNSTLRVMFKATLQVGDQIIISQQELKVFDSNGNEKTVNSTGLGLDTGIVVEWTAKKTLLPSYYQTCDGTAINRITNAALFAVIGTGYGAGNGTTTFNVPDKRGKYSIGACIGISSGNTCIPATNITGSNLNTGGTTSGALNISTNTTTVVCGSGATVVTSICGNASVIPPFSAAYMVIHL